MDERVFQQLVGSAPCCNARCGSTRSTLNLWTPNMKHTDQYIRASKNHSCPTFMFTINNLSASSYRGFSDLPGKHITHHTRTAPCTPRP